MPAGQIGLIDVLGRNSSCAGGSCHAYNVSSSDHQLTFCLILRQSLCVTSWMAIDVQSNILPNSIPLIKNPTSVARNTHGRSITISCVLSCASSHCLQQVHRSDCIAISSKTPLVFLLQQLSDSRYPYQVGSLILLAS